MNLENKLDNNIDIPNKQNEFLNSTIYKVVNMGINMGLKILLPDLIENQIISIKDTLIENGLKEGLKKVINEAINIGKGFNGIIKGDFENIEQINMAISSGGMIDTISELIDFSINKVNSKNIINKNILSLIKNGKNIILDNVRNKIKEELKNQNNYFNILNNSVKKWKENYKSKNFYGMEKEYNIMLKNLDKIIPIENTIKEIRKIETLHNLIKNKGENFNISDQELDFINNYA